VTPPVFLATKLEECRLSPPELRNDLAAQFHELLNASAFLEALPAFLPPDQASQQRLPDLSSGYPMAWIQAQLDVVDERLPCLPDTSQS